MDHINIVKYYETYKDNNNFYLVMENCSNGDLMNMMIKASKFLEEEEIVGWFKSIVVALNHCHNNQVCHRDIKPQNICFGEDG